MLLLGITTPSSDTCIGDEAVRQGRNISLVSVFSVMFKLSKVVCQSLRHHCLLAVGAAISNFAFAQGVASTGVPAAASALIAAKPDGLGLLLDLPPPSAAKPTPAAGSAASSGGAGKALMDAFMVAGNFSCAPRIKQVGEYLLRGAESGAFLFFNEAAPDQRQVGVALEIASPASGTSSYASAEFSSEASGDCGASYQAITYWPTNCAELARTKFADNPPLGLLKRNIAVLELSKLGRVFLMPAGSGCVSIKRELLP